MLSKNDAKYIEVIHTDSKCYGIEAELGHTDFYINGGNNQPGCNSDLQHHRCSHQRCVDIYAESLEAESYLYGSSCDKLNDDVGKTNILLGGEPGKSISGAYCLKTSDRAPFGMGSRK